MNAAVFLDGRQVFYADAEVSHLHSTLVNDLLFVNRKLVHADRVQNEEQADGHVAADDDVRERAALDSPAADLDLLADAVGSDEESRIALRLGTERLDKTGVWVV